MIEKLLCFHYRKPNLQYALTVFQENHNFQIYREWLQKKMQHYL